MKLCPKLKIKNHSITILFKIVIIYKDSLQFQASFSHNLYLRYDKLKKQN